MDFGYKHGISGMHMLHFENRQQHYWHRKKFQQSHLRWAYMAASCVRQDSNFCFYREEEIVFNLLLLLSMRAAQTFVQHSTPLSWVKIVKHLAWRVVAPNLKKTNFLQFTSFTVCKRFFEKKWHLRDCLKSPLEAKRLYPGPKLLAQKWKNHSLMAARLLRYHKKQKKDLPLAINRRLPLPRWGFLPHFIHMKTNFLDKVKH